MHISETHKFVVRFILPPTLIVVLIFLIIIPTFPNFRLGFREFTLIYWSFIIVSSILNHRAMKWTEYVVKHYGLQREKNPVVRKMFAKERGLRQYWITWLCLYIVFFFVYFLGVNVQVLLPFLILPSWLLAIVLYDFLNDFYQIRKLRRKGIA
jgi:hypothetical protein